MATAQAGLCYGTFQVRVNRRELSNPFEIVKQALAIDADLKAVFDHACDFWRYEIKPSGCDRRIFFGQSYHAYKGYMQVEMWAAMRALRLSVNEIIRDTLLSGFAARPPRFCDETSLKLFQAATESLVILQSDILASVPQILGYPSKNTSDGPETGPQGSVPGDPMHMWSSVSDDSYTRYQRNKNLTPSLPSLRMGGGYTLIWYIHSAGLTKVSTDDAKSWVVRILRIIADQMGIEQASLLASLLERDIDPTC